MSNWKFEKHVDGQNEVITIVRPIDDKPRSTECVSRTVKAGTIAHVQIATIDDDFNIVIDDGVRQFDKILDEEGIIKEIRKNNVQAKVKVTEFKVAQEDILGIPRDIFNAVAVKVERPLSQQ